MTMPFPKKPWLRGVFLTAVGGILVAVACWAPSPSEAPQEEADAQAVVLPPEVKVPALVVEGTRQRTRIPPSPEVIRDWSYSELQEARAVGATPSFTPYTVRPDIKNRVEVARALEREYPPLLKDAGIGGTAQIWFYIASSGEVERLMVRESSGHEALDNAALRVAGAIEFTPALNRNEAAPVWISLPITFAADATPAAAEARKPETPWAALKHFLAVTVQYLQDWIQRLFERIPRGGEKADANPAPAAGSSSGEAPLLPDADLSAAPTFTPFTVRPDIKNRTEVARALEREYPPLLRDPGIGGTTQVWFFIDETGRVQRAQVNQTSGHRALDEAALRVAELIEFTPALNREKAVPVWISLPITFTTRGGSSDGASAAGTKPEWPEPPEDVAPERDLAAAPTFTPYTVRPDIKNRGEVARALEQAYPPSLRDAGIGGTTQVWFFIDADGVVQRVQVNQTSGHQALDEAAVDVAWKIQFTPALKDDTRVPVWISLPITFTTR